MNFIRRTRRFRNKFRLTLVRIMAAVYASIKDILSIKVKVRHDGYCEQYSRIFMMKTLVIGSMVVALNWYTDKTMCMIPDDTKLTSEFISDACWIQGFYIYEDLRYDDKMSYYGVSLDIDKGGRNSDGNLCAKDSTRGNDADGCVRLKKRVYVQYQYMPFFIAALAVLYYIPHVVYKMINSDLISLKEKLREFDSDTILKNFFDYKSNSRSKMRSRVLGNLLVKILYICSNVGSYIAIDKILNGKYMDFYWIWKTWITFDTSKNNIYGTAEEDYARGNTLLPTFGICEIREAMQHRSSTDTNHLKFVCEFSQHILYHYTFIFLWFLILVGIFISFTGLMLQLASYCIDIGGFMKQTRQSKGMYKLTFREFEYLEFIRRKNVAFFNKVRDGIMKERIGMFTSPQIDTSPAMQPPCYPLSDDSEDMFPPIKYNA